MKKRVAFALFVLICFRLLAGCITPNAGMLEATDRQPEATSNGLQYQCDPFPEGFLGSLKYYQKYCPEQSVNSLRKKFEVAIKEFITDHGVPADYLPSAKHYLFLLLVGTYRPGRICYPDFDTVTVEYTTDLPDDINGSCPFAMEVQIITADGKGPVILYWDDNYMYFSVGDTWVYLWDMSIIHNDSGANLHATQEECFASVATVLTENGIARYKSPFNNQLTVFFEKSGFTDYPLFTSAWMDKPHKGSPPSDDELVLYLKDSVGNIYCFINNMKDSYVSYNGKVISYYNSYIAW